MKLKMNMKCCRHPSVVLGILTLLASTHVWSQPANDSCLTPEPIGEGIFLFSTVGATSDGIDPGCGGLTSPHDVWFQYSPTDTGTVTLGTCGSSFDTRLAVWELQGCPPGPVAPLACADNDCGSQSSLTFQAIVGQVYTIQVGGHDQDTGDGELFAMLGPCIRIFPGSLVCAVDMEFNRLNVSWTVGAYGGTPNKVDIYYNFNGGAYSLLNPPSPVTVAPNTSYTINHYPPQPGAYCYRILPTCEPSPPKTCCTIKFKFTRGDANGDSLFDIADPIRLLGRLFSGQAALPCDDAGDVNADQLLNIADPIYALQALFTPGSAPPPPPFPDCGEAPGPDLGCASSPGCP